MRLATWGDILTGGLVSAVQIAAREKMGHRILNRSTTDIERLYSDFGGSGYRGVGARHQPRVSGRETERDRQKVERAAAFLYNMNVSNPATRRPLAPTGARPILIPSFTSR